MFRDRLRAAQAKGDLTIADLSRWFDRPYPTLSTWLQGRVPRGPAGREADRRLALLENAIREGAFPPPHVAASHSRRVQYVEMMRNAILARVPESNTAGRRA